MPGLRQRLTQEEQLQRPNRIQLPHVAEVAERIPTELRIAEHAPECARVESGPGAQARAFGHAHVHEHRAEGGQRRCRPHDHAPFVAECGPLHQVGQRSADAQRADHDAQSQSEPGIRPRGDDFHADRVDPGQRHTGEKTQRHGQRQPIAHREPCVDRDSRQRRGKKDTACREPISQVEQREQQRAGDEAELRRRCQRSALRAVETPFDDEIGGDGRAGEPDRRRQHDGQGQNGSRTIGGGPHAGITPLCGPRFDLGGGPA